MFGPVMINEESVFPVDCLKVKEAAQAKQRCTFKQLSYMDEADLSLVMKWWTIYNATNYILDTKQYKY